MSTQQDIYAAGSENRPPMLNKENYVPWSSRLLRRMIPEPGDEIVKYCSCNAHEQSMIKLTVAEIKQMDADDQAIQPNGVECYIVHQTKVKDEIFPIVNQVDARLQNFEIQFLKEAAKFIRDFKSLTKEAGESLVKHKALELEIERLLRAVVSQDIMSIVQTNSVVDTSNLQTKLERMKERFENCIIKKENEYAKLWNDWAAFMAIITSFSRGHGMALFLVLFNIKVDETNDLSNPVISNSVPTPQESKVVKIDNVIALGMFMINPSKTSRQDKFMPINKVRVSVRTNPITVLQPHVITKKSVNSNLNGLSSTGVDNTAKTRRPQPRRNTKNNRVSSESKSSCIKSKEVEVEVHHENLLLSDE
ncbi:hypothetical protein Tco_1291739 [Tanacetum coccineum]